MAGLALAFFAPAYAADIPFKAPRTAAVATAGGLYVWADGSYQSFNLPTFDVGVLRDTPATLSAGPFESYNTRASGYGISGAVGYVLPYGALPAIFGSNARIEVGASYVDAKGSQSGAGSDPIGGGLLWELLNGLMFADTGCVGGVCSTTSTLTTHYTGWNVNLKAAGDYVFGAVTVSPSILAFGGEVRNRQTISQLYFNAGFPGAPLGSYTANSSLRWVDWGARVGLESTWSITNTVAFGLGGNVGIASRSASLAADDTCGCAGFSGGSVVNTSAMTMPFLANAEASLALKLTPAVALKSFVGVNYDSRVPGISAQNHDGPVAVSTFGTPAGIKFSGETSWYAGGGLTVKFGL